jgi:putrescine transport system substrate-binding protein
MYRTDTQVGIVNKISYANAVRASDPLIKPEIRANHGVFLKSEDLTKMVPLSALTNDVRRLRTKTYTSFKSGIE